MEIICNTISFRSKKLEEFIPILSELGLNKLELHAGHFYNKRINYKKIRNIFESNEIKVKVISGGWSNFTTNDNTFKNIEKQIHIIKKLNCNKIRLFLGRLERKYFNDKIRKFIVKNLIHLSIKYPNIHFLFETHDGISLDYKIMYNLFNSVNKDNILIAFDPVNIEMKNIDSYSALENLYSFIGHMHLKGMKSLSSGKKLLCEYGSGDFSFDKILSYLKQKNYKNYLSIEYEGNKNPYIVLSKSYIKLKKDVGGL
jgi:sugar phosphate isomerase/epimerase